MAENTERRVRVLINPKSGLWWSSTGLQRLIQQHWDIPGHLLTYQFSRSPEDGIHKTRAAVEEGIDTILVVGGDGMINSIGSALIGTGVSLGVIPMGSGNGFARHFDIPLTAEKAVVALLKAARQDIDVGTINGRPFFVTCGLAGDGALVETFEKSPVRGVLPYVLSGAFEFFDYKPKPFQFVMDGERNHECRDPFIFTVANLTQYGGGAQIAPNAKHDDGLMELVIMARSDWPRLIPNFPKLFSGKIDQLPEVTTHRFRSLVVKRSEPGPVQMDGELLSEPAEVEIKVLPKSLSVLVPDKSKL